MAGVLQIHVDNRSIHNAKENVQQWGIYTYSGRTFFVMGNNYMGLAPNISRSGEGLSIGFGCHVPLLVRPLEMRKLWTAIGEVIEQKH